MPLARPPAFPRHGSGLCCERASLERLATQFGTPLYVYSAASIRGGYRAFERAFDRVPHTVCYSVKANPSLALLRLLARMGAGFDVVSGGELERVRRADRRAVQRVVFSGVGKTGAEMDAALRAGILLFNVESASELELLAQRAARLRIRAPLALRVNPDVPAATHPYISTGLRQHKFGVPIAEALHLYHQAARQQWLAVAGISLHIGSQITSVAPFRSAMARVARLARRLKSEGFRIRYLDAGGGLGIPYQRGGHVDFAAYARAVTAPLRGLNTHLLLEPGRALVGPAGALLARVLYVKRNGRKRFLILDAAMNDLLRPALYDAWHAIVPVASGPPARRHYVYDVVGPICESSDFLARDRKLPEMAEGDLVAILDAGAYGMSLASNYNSRPRAAEVLVEGRTARLIRRRETSADLLRVENLDR
jgi:diaminopimelate decarboxylase